MRVHLRIWVGKTNRVDPIKTLGLCHNNCYAWQRTHTGMRLRQVSRGFRRAREIGRTTLETYTWVTTDLPAQQILSHGNYNIHINTTHCTALLLRLILRHHLHSRLLPSVSQVPHVIFSLPYVLLPPAHPCRTMANLHIIRNVISPGSRPVQVAAHRLTSRVVV